MEVSDGRQTALSQSLIEASDECTPEGGGGTGAPGKIAINAAGINAVRVACDGSNVRELPAVEDRILSLRDRRNENLGQRRLP